MEHDTPLCFGPFRLDPVYERVWRGEQALNLGAKAFALLSYLAGHPGRLVKKDELLKAVWPDAYVTQTVLKVHMHAIREALGEEAGAPLYIETVPRLGYRFVGGKAAEEAERAPAAGRLGGRRIVGRKTEVTRLHGWLAQALRGERQVIFVTGEPGIGKTTVVELFLALTPNTQHPTPSPWIGRGQCLEQYGAGEAYLPVLEAVGQVCREPGGEQVVAVLRRYAPTWLVQMPGLIKESDLEALQQQIQGVTRERMLREMAEAIEALTAERGLILVVEDLQWCDRSTLELLAYLAQRRQRARLLIIGAYRPAQVVANDHPLKGVKQELHARGYCDELRLELLTEEDIGAYVAERFGACAFATELSRLIHQRTEGNALFMVNLVEYCVQQGLLREIDGRWELQGRVEDIGVPENLRQMIAKQIEQLHPDEQRVLETASVAGMEFAAASVAAGLKRDTEAIEEVCEELAWKGRFLQEKGLTEWPDGTVSGRYAFRHALYQSVLYERMAPARRVRCHRAIGERIEAGSTDQVRTIAAELALHFERGREYQKAVQYLQQAGENAIRCSAPHEAVTHLTKGIALLTTFSTTPERAQRELVLQTALGAALIAAKGYAAPDVEQAYARALELCQQLGNPLQRFQVLLGLWAVYSARADLQTAHELGEQLLTFAQRVHNPSSLLWAHYLLGITLFALGRIAPARAHLEQGMDFYDPQHHRSPALQNPGVTCLAYTAWVLWHLGYPDQARKKLQDALAMARELSHPFSLAYTLHYAVIIHHIQGKPQAAQELAETFMAVSTGQEFEQLVTEGTILQGRLLAEQGRTEEGIAQMKQGLAARRAIGVEIARPYCLALLAEACAKAGQVKEGLAALAEALAAVNHTKERHYEAELYRLRGELTLSQSSVQGLGSSVKKSGKSKVKSGKLKFANTQHPTPYVQVEVEREAEECFLKAIDIARTQQTKSLELRATMSLVRLRRHQALGHGSRNTRHASHATHHETRARLDVARAMLSEIYNWFTEGFDTPDLQEAKALLEELG